MVGGSQVPTRSDGRPGPVPPPPFTGTPPSKGTATLDKDQNRVDSSACFLNLGGSLGPNIISVAGWNVYTGQGTVDLYANQSIADCVALSPQGDPAMEDMAIEIAEQDLDWDSDGDGCIDADELSHGKGPPPPKKCGDDPYNPFDSDNNLDSVGDLTINAVPADWDTEENTGGDTGGAGSCFDGKDNGGGDGADGDDPDDCDLIPGSYFNCIFDSQHAKGKDVDDKKDGLQEAVNLRLFCYADDGLGVIPVNETGYPGEFGDGMPGSPPPGKVGGSAEAGPYASVGPGQCVNATDDDGDGTANDGCPENIPPEEIPNTAKTDATDSESGADCTNALDDDADGAVNDGCPASGLPEVGAACADALDENTLPPPFPGNAENDPAPDAVNDGCPQVANPETGAQCGNKADDDGDTVVDDGCPNGTSSESGAQCGNKLDDDSDGVVDDGCPAGTSSESGAQCTNTLDDDADGFVNDGCPTVKGGADSEVGPDCDNDTDDDRDDAVNDGCPTVGSAEVGVQCGNDTDDDTDGKINDGCPQVANPETGLGPVIANGVWNHLSNSIEFDICVLDSGGTLGHVIASAIIDAHTGHGPIDIFAFQTEADCLAGTPDGFPIFEGTIDLAETAPKGADWDTDLDGCTDKQELGNIKGLGGLRDPYNRWDFMDMWVNKARDRRVNIIDIGALIQRFGDTDTDPDALNGRNDDPLDAPQALTGYHNSADRSPPIIGSNTWNLAGPDGRINIIEIGEAIAQFGNTCAP
jgi:hypothetical protein